MLYLIRRSLLVCIAFSSLFSCHQQELFQYRVLSPDGRYSAHPSGLGFVIFNKKGAAVGGTGYCSPMFYWLPFALCDHSAFSYSSDGTLLAATTFSSFHTAVKVYKNGTWNLMWEHVEPSVLGSEMVRGLAFSENDTKLNVIRYGSWQVFDASSGKLLSERNIAVNRSVQSQNKHIVIGQEGAAILFDSDGDEQGKVYTCSQFPIGGLALSADEKSLVITDTMGNVCLFDRENGKLKWRATVNSFRAVPLFDPVSGDIILGVYDHLIVYRHASREKSFTVTCPGEIFDMRIHNGALFILRRPLFRLPLITSAPLPVGSEACAPEK